MSAIGRRARRLLRRVSHTRETGTEPVLIDELVSPLRYDVLVRERFLDRISGLRDPAELQDAVASPAGRDYFTWYSRIVVPRFLPEIVGDHDAIDVAFSDRVRRTVELSRSFASAGYDPTQLVLLHSGRRIAPTSTGKRLERRTFAGDGCHRLALLRLHGVTVLEPGSYRVEVAPTLSPIDNTAELIAPLGLTRRAYFEFLSLAYAPGTICPTERELLERVRARSPERLEELGRVLGVDLPLLAPDPP